jgi:hypothetical protein
MKLSRRFLAEACALAVFATAVAAQSPTGGNPVGGGARPTTSGGGGGSGVDL